MKAKVLFTSLPPPCVLCLGYICGIALSPGGLWGLSAGLCLLIWSWSRRSLLVALLAVGILFGCWMAAEAYTKAERLLAAGSKLTESSLQLEVTQAAERAGDKVLLYGKTKAGLSLKVESRSYFLALPGDRILVKGKFSPLEQDEESTFNYPIYLAKNGTAAVFRAYEGRIEKPGSNSFQRGMAVVRRVSLERIASLWPGDVGALIAGILVGARGSFSETLVNSMRNTGLMHIVAVSGSNMTILINAILVLTTALAMRWRVVLATFTLTLFTLFVGPSGAVVRACLMGVITLLAELYGRPSTAFLCLIYAGTIMLMVSPLDLLYDIGFQLSFLAVLGLLWGEACMAPFCAWMPKYLADQLRPTLAAIAWTLPISIIYFGNVSLIAPIANLIVPPSIPMLMLGGFITFALSWVPGFQILTWPLGMLVQLWTSAVLWISEQLANLPYAAVPITMDPRWSLPFGILAYSLLALWAYRKSGK